MVSGDGVLVEQQAHLLGTIVSAVRTVIVVVVRRSSPSSNKRLFHQRFTVHPPCARIFARDMEVFVQALASITVDHEHDFFHEFSIQLPFVDDLFD